MAGLAAAERTALLSRRLSLEYYHPTACLLSLPTGPLVVIQADLWIYRQAHHRCNIRLA
jgi:hypothetical protein